MGYRGLKFHVPRAIHGVQGKRAPLSACCTAYLSIFSGCGAQRVCMRKWVPGNTPRRAGRIQCSEEKKRSQDRVIFSPLQRIARLQACRGTFARRAPSPAAAHSKFQSSNVLKHVKQTQTAKRPCMQRKQLREAVQRNFARVPEFPTSRSRVHLATLLTNTVFAVREANRYSGLRSLHVVHGD